MVVELEVGVGRLTAGLNQEVSRENDVRAEWQGRGRVEGPLPSFLPSFLPWSFVPNQALMEPGVH